jgi:cell division protein FtsB
MLFSVFFRVLLVLIAMTLVIGNWRGENVLATYFSLIESRNNLEKAVGKLEAESEDLQNEVVKITTSKSYADRILKDKYHITGEGERIIFFAD